MTEQYVTAAPPSGGITWADHKGALLVVTPLGIETGVATVHGPSDCIRADVLVITGPGTGEEFPDCLVFPKVLQGQLRNQLGHKVVGRLGQGAAKPGQSAPWMLEAATADDIAKAQAYKPAAAAAPAAPAGWPAAPAAAAPSVTTAAAPF